MQASGILVVALERGGSESSLEAKEDGAAYG